MLRLRFFTLQFMLRNVKFIGLLLLASSLSYAQEIKTEAAQVQQVIVDGMQTDLEKNREFVAGKLIVGRKTIAESGLQNVGEILRREPSITIGKDGRIGLMGLPGYTQVLVDGVPPTGKDPYEIDLLQVEKIEIIKSATAATGPFGIAGTINIIHRNISPASFSQYNVNAAQTAGRTGASLSWMNNRTIPNAPLSFNLSVSAKRNSTLGRDNYQQILLDPQAEPVLKGMRTSANTTEYALATGELLWKLNAMQNIRIVPDVGHVTFSRKLQEQRRSTSEFTLDTQQNSGDVLSSYSLPVLWTWRTEDNDSFELKFNVNHLSSSNSNTIQTDSEPQTSKELRLVGQRSEINNKFLTFNYKAEFGVDHDVEFGTNFSRHTAITAYNDTVDGFVDPTLALLGTRNSMQKQVQRVFVQDDWRWNKSLAVNIGVSTEQQKIIIYEMPTHSVASFRMISPSAHLVKKIDGDNKRQFRISLARTFQAPTFSQLVLHPSINALSPCNARGLCAGNSPDTPDRVGNPMLQPERALGINASYTYGVKANSEISLEYYLRNISQKVGSELSREDVFWSNQPRYIVRAINLGEARSRGIDLSMKLLASDLWKSAPRLEVSGNVGFSRSALSSIPGPDNHLLDQTPWHAKFSLAYTLKDFPLKFNLDGNLLPGDWVRNSLSQRTYQSRKNVFSMAASWVIRPDYRLSLNVENIVSTDVHQIDEYATGSGILQQSTQARNYARAGLQLEIKMKN